MNGENIISDDTEVSETLNTFFQSAVQKLEIKENSYLLTDNSDVADPIDAIIKKFENHPSILTIKENVKPSSFMFTELSLLDIETEINKLNPKKSGTFKNIPTKHLIQTSDICSKTLLKIWNNEIIGDKQFPDKLKLADITPVFKKEDTTQAKNYRPVSVLPTVSKIFERLMHNKMTTYIDKHLSTYLCGYRKGYNAQYALISLLEKWKKSLDQKNYAGAILMDLSKAFDTINHELLLAKLHAYGFDKTALAIIKSYLTNRWQHTKINTAFSSWTELLNGVPQGSILGPLLFNIYINDLFFNFAETDICNNADDTTLYACDSNLQNLITRLERDSINAIVWFENNYMKLNEEKCHFIISGNKIEHLWAKIGDAMIWESSKEKLLGVTIDTDLKFDEHVSNLCLRAGRKLTALARLTKIISFDKRRLLLKSFVESQFAYCPLTWMFYSRKLNNKINKIHERALRIVYQNFTLSFEDLLKKDDSVPIHYRNLRSMAIELYKAKHGLLPTIAQDIFKIRDYNGPSLRSHSEFTRAISNSVYKGDNSLRSLGPIIWDMVPESIKGAPSLISFKCLIKKWIHSKCPCRLCKDYIQGLGYL